MRSVLQDDMEVRLQRAETARRELIAKERQLRLVRIAPYLQRGLSRSD